MLKRQNVVNGQTKQINDDPIETKFKVVQAESFKKVVYLFMLIYKNYSHWLLEWVKHVITQSEIL